MDSDIQHFTRYKGYDYSRGASLFVTIVTEPRAARFGRVVDGAVSLSPLGAQVAESLCSMPTRVPDVTLFGWVIMPDHIHCRVYLKPNLAEPLKTLGRFFGPFKSYTTKCAWDLGGAGKLWQQGYHDRICSTRPFIDAVERYIRYNPLKYELRHNHPERLRIREPLDSPRLDAETFWRGIGNTGLLNGDTKLLGLRVSRKLTPEAMMRVVSRCHDAVNAGYAILSGFISPGEKAVRDALLARPEAKLLHILPSSMPHAYMPESLYLEALQGNRLLILAKGNDDTPFSKSACDALNADVAHIANAGEGLAAYWRDGGAPAVLT